MEILTTLKIGFSKVVIGALLTLSGWAGIPLAPQSLGADTMQYVGGTTYTLSGSGVSSSGTSIPLISLTIPQNSYPLQDSDFASTFYLTFEPGSQTRQEFASCTTVSANTGAAVTLSGCTRGLSPISPYTASTTLRFTHAGGTKIIFSNSPAFYDQFVAKGNDETITGVHTFSTSPIVPTPTTATQAANKTYVDTVTNAGAATSTESLGGIVELGTLAEQASSYDGGINKPTVLQTKNSTSTCQVVGSYNIVASSTTGKLDKGCFDQTALYTLTATTTIHALVFPDSTSQTTAGVGVEAIGLGDGSDGDVTISGNTSLTRDMFYNNLTVNTGVTLTTDGHRIFVKGTLTGNGTGHIAYNGNAGGAGGVGGTASGNTPGSAGSAGAAGSALSMGSISGGKAGVAGGAGGIGGTALVGTGAAGGAGGAISNATSSIGTTGTAGVAGGAGSNGYNGTPGSAGGAGTTAATLTNPKAMPRIPQWAIDLYDRTTSALLNGSAQSAAGGGGGGGGSGNSVSHAGGGGGGGGGSGSAGGIVLIAAKTIVSPATDFITALGGAGGAGGAGGVGALVSGECGGSGGGGGGGSGGQGGVIVLLYKTLSGTTPTTAGLTGGTGGALGAGGAACSGTGGAVGTNGTVGTTGGTGVLYSFSL